MKSVVTYNPDSVLSVFDDWDRMIGDYLGRGARSGSSASTSGYPAVDIKEEKDRYVLDAEMPGLGEKDVDIKVNDRVLSIASVRQEESAEEKSGHFLIRERGIKTFRRAFTLPRDVNVDKISASFKDGLLSVVLPKRPETQEKTISIARG